jgi:hypothetical protein
MKGSARQFPCQFKTINVSILSLLIPLLNHVALFLIVLNYGCWSFEVHARRLAALKALTSCSTSSSEMMEKLNEIVFGILEKVGHP